MDKRTPKILITTLRIGELSGCDIYYYELSKYLSCDYKVTILADYNPESKNYKELKELCRIIPHSENKDIEKEEFDIIISSQRKPTEWAYNTFHKSDPYFISIIHSEYAFAEEPFVNKRIRYIAIRKSIKDWLYFTYKIPRENIEVIYNGVDITRFNTNNTTINKNFPKEILFIGPIEWLRKDCILTLFTWVLQHKNDYNNRPRYILKIIGEGDTNQINKLRIKYQVENIVTFHKFKDNIEEDIKKCDIVSGFLFGRINIEGFFCGKPSIIFDHRIQPHWHDVPTLEELEKFKITNVCMEVEKLWKQT